MDTITLRNIYPEHKWLDLSNSLDLNSILSTEQLADRDYNLDRVQLNQICMKAMKAWLSEILDTEVELAFPCKIDNRANLQSISQLVNGFALQVGKTRLICIPSQSLDLNEIEIPKEWVDLSNWVGDYYLPVQLDLEGKFIRLWNFISHRDLKERADFDSVFLNYQLTSMDGTEDLDVLFTACEFHRQGKLVPAKGAIEPLMSASERTAPETIRKFRNARPSLPLRLQLRKLDLSFNDYAGILNDEKWLKAYLKPGENKLIDKATEDLTLYLENLKRDGWILLENFLHPPQAIADLDPFIEVQLDSVRGTLLSSPEEIKAAIAKVYQQQNDVHQPHRINGVEDLVPLLENCKNEKVWWQAAEYLWAIKPDLPPSVAIIEELDRQFAGRKIAMMVAWIKTPQDRLAVLVRLYLVDGELSLPPLLQLSLRDARDVNFLVDARGNQIVATSRLEVPSNSIQLYFSADFGDRFKICLNLDNTEVIKEFPLPQPHKV